MSERFKYKLGWIPDYPDFRDYTDDNEKILPMVKKVGTSKTEALPGKTDLRKWCSPIKNQLNIGSCTAHAVTGVVEYFENKAFGKHIEASRLFLYKATRNLLHFTGDTGAFLRSTIGALTLFGVSPEDYWPYDTSRLDEEPSAFCYAFGQNYRCLSYFRHDPPHMSSKDIIASIKKYLAAGIPSVFGFTVYQSINQADSNGQIPFPSGREKLMGGHAVAAVGYDDRIEITNIASCETTVGAILIRNSWGTGWGEDGYGWLPYEYIRKGLAQDWWSVLKQDWVDTGIFLESADI